MGDPEVTPWRTQEMEWHLQLCHVPEVLLGAARGLGVPQECACCPDTMSLLEGADGAESNSVDKTLELSSLLPVCGPCVYGTLGKLP